jgi:hypothetical protein
MNYFIQLIEKIWSDIARSKITNLIRRQGYLKEGEHGVIQLDFVKFLKRKTFFNAQYPSILLGENGFVKREKRESGTLKISMHKLAYPSMLSIYFYFIGFLFVCLFLIIPV